MVISTLHTTASTSKSGFVSARQVSAATLASCMTCMREAKVNVHLDASLCQYILPRVRAALCYAHAVLCRRPHFQGAGCGRRMASRPIRNSGAPTSAPLMGPEKCLPASACSWLFASLPDLHGPLTVLLNLSRSPTCLVVMGPIVTAGIFLYQEHCPLLPTGASDALVGFC